MDIIFVSLSLTTGPTFQGTDGPNTADSTRLNIGETATYVATFEVNQTAVNDQGISNRFWLLQNGVRVQDRNDTTLGSVDDGNDDDDKNLYRYYHSNKRFD